MAVRYVWGRAGKGKSHYIYQEIQNELASGSNTRLILLVPEQFTLQAERDLINQLNLPGIMQLEVLSFTRLAQRVFNEVGGLTRVLINEQGKNMVLRKIVDDSSGELTIYKKASKQDGFLKQFNKLLTELKQQDILPQFLQLPQYDNDNENKINDTYETNDIIRQKLHDIAIIYDRFNLFLQDRYVDMEDYTNLFIQKIEKSHLIKDAKVWIDGFTTFSPQSIKIIEKIMLLAEDTTISFTIDYVNNRDAEIFELSRRSCHRLHQMARELGLREDIIRIDPEPANQLKSREIQHLERELYSFPGKIFLDKVQNIRVFAAANLNSEIETAAAEIIALVREGYRWKDLALVCHDMDRYGSLIKRTFNDYGIPYFMDQKRDVLSHPIIELVLSALEIIRRGYRYDDVFALLKTGFAGITINEAEILENYVLKYGIKGDKWKEEFTLGEAELLADINRCRQVLVTPLNQLSANIKGKKTTAELTQALHEYLQNIEIHQQLSQWIEAIRAKGYYDEANESSQIWNTILQIFDQMVEILGDQEVSLKEFKRILEAGFLSFELGVIPSTVDQVLVGSIQRSKSHDIKALFVIGVNDGILPAGKDEDGIFSVEEKELIQGKGLELGFDREMMGEEERFLIYGAISKPLEKIWLSYSMADGEGRALRPSLLIDRFKKIFKHLVIESNVVKNKQWQLQMVSTPESTFKHLIENLRLSLDAKPTEDFWRDVYRWYYEQEKWQVKRAAIIRALYHRNQTGYIGREKAASIYRAPFRSSVSRLEQFIKCPFAHFVHYGLKPWERKVYEVRNPDIGEIFHKCIQSFSRQITEQNLTWSRLKKEECESMAETVMDNLLPAYGNGIFFSNPRNQYLAKRLKRIARRAVVTLTEHIQKGNFQPLGHEISFGINETFPAIKIDLPQGIKIFLEGRIDRFDLLKHEGTGYVKIIDYKSGNQNFSLSDIYHGLALQLIVYLRAVLAVHDIYGCNQFKPAGVFYYKIDDPMINTEEKEIKVIEQEIRRKLRMKGLALEDIKVVRQMDLNLQGSSDIIPVAIKQNDEFYASSSVINEADFQGLINHVERLLLQTADEIINGQIRIAPVNHKRNLACKYCSYHSVCQFDPQFEDNAWRNARNLPDEEVLARIRKQN